MKINSRSLFTIVCLIILMQFNGCKKKTLGLPQLWDTTCNITHMSFNYSLTNIEANFAYNSSGYPVTVTLSATNTGSPNITFLYDKYNRLTDYIGTYDTLDPLHLPTQFSYEFWYRYVYADQDVNGNPVGDTSRNFGIYRNGDLSLVTAGTYIEHFTYDEKGRIIQVTAPNAAPVTYVYDANGNLNKTSTQTYDNKKCFRSTNKIWMLVDRDYSVNNLFVADNYDAEGFPTLINRTASFLHRTLLLKSLDYSCAMTRQKAANTDLAY